MANDLSKQTEEQLEISLKDNFTPENLSSLLDMMVKFPQMAHYNILLLLRQKPDASLICGRQAWESYGGRVIAKKPIIIFCPEFETLEAVDEDNGSLIGRTGELLLRPVPCFDISQVEISEEKKNELVAESTRPNFIDALRRHGHRIMIDDVNEPKLHHLKASVYDSDTNVLLLNYRLSQEEQQKETLRTFVEWYINNHYRMDAEQGRKIRAYIKELQDYATEVVKRYYGVSDVFEVTPSKLFSEPSEIQGIFLYELSKTVFTILQMIENRSSLTFNETMFCNIFLTTTNREDILNEINDMLDKTVIFQLVHDLLVFRSLFMSERTISQESVEELYKRRENKELFTFPSKTYTCNG